MGDEHCSCGTDANDRTEWDDETGGRYLDAPALDTELPASMQPLLGNLLGRESVSSLAEWATGVRTHTDGDAIGLSELCFTEEKTNHWGVLNDERYDFLCFYDAVIMAAIADVSVDIRTMSPDGTVIEARAVGNEIVDASPASAVFSFGVDASIAKASSEDPSIERAYMAICPYVKAFRDVDAYRKWAGAVPAETIALPLQGATNLAGALVD